MDKNKFRENIKSEFRYYLTHVARSSRRTKEGFNLGETAVGSFIIFLEPQKLFDYNIEKWKHIESIYDITDSIQINKIAKELLNDKAFIDHDNKDNQGWRSGAISHYVCFINAKTFFSKEEKLMSMPALTNASHQIIYYGAPGTGKSHIINKTAEAQPKGNVFRTTFHPDSDYSTFVGCYKPTKEATNTLSLLKLQELYPEFKKKVDNRPLHRFITKCYSSFRLLTEKEAESVFDKIETSSTVTAEVPKIMAAIEEFPSNSSITYSFVPQSFTKAYVRAWQTDEPIYLVIEEINRGNCAQIFGDLFQLLDRKDGFSEYPIKADNDLAQYLSEQFSNNSREDIPENVKSGEELVLPDNLYIWATMNTSDQSLFPIDSAFKRRWDWKYVPISNTGKNWRIEVNNKQYDWWDFLEKINKKIGEVTNSEDKKLGYFFCKAINGTISAETFVGKVIFYIWNDVFKDFAEEAGGLFKGDNDSTLSFNEFYTVDGAGNAVVNEAKVALFLQNLGIKPNSSDNEEDMLGEDDELDELDEFDNENKLNQRDKSTYSINGNGDYYKKWLPYETVSLYVKNNPDSTAEDIARIWGAIKTTVTVIFTEKEYTAKKERSEDKSFETRYDAITLKNEEKIYVFNQFSLRRINDFISKVNSQDWGIHIERKE